MKLSNAHLTRQLDIIPMETLKTPISVVGAGAIGSWVILSLAKMGFQDITAYDDDTVEVENMSSQFYPFSAIGQNKAVALQELVKTFTQTAINAIPQRYEGKSILPGIVISAVDSMGARRMIWEAHAGKTTSTSHIIDPRMGAESALLYVMSPMSTADRKSYGKTLYSDENAVQERCTAKATIYTANLLAGQVCKAVKDIVVGSNYTRVSQWNIAANQVMMWSSKT